MITAETRVELDAALAGPADVALVPTLGALHDGHVALIDRAHDLASRVVVSIFVNPLQFGSQADLSRYPRTLDADLAICREHGVDVVFAPTVEVMYPAGEPLVTVDPGPGATILEGASRPGHFRGVLTVVAKLFGLVRPDVAVFGEKDYQQLALIRQLVRDLSMGVDIVGVETVRDPDGLALSSRNRFLTDDERAASLTLSQALAAGRAAGGQGADAVLAAAAEVFARAPAVEVDYVSIRGVDLGDPPVFGEARLLVAVQIGTVRLIDNQSVSLGVDPTADLPSTPD